MSDKNDLSKGWIKLYDDEDFSDRVLTISGGTNHPDFDKVQTDDGKKGFEDKATSVRWDIPKGWLAAAFHHKDYKGKRIEFRGKGEDAHLGSDSDEISSLRWEQA